MARGAAPGGPLPIGESFVLIAVAAIVGFVSAWLLAVSRTSRVENDRLQEVSRLLDRERAEADRALLRLRRQLEEVEGRERDHTDLFQRLPDLVGQMFAAGTRREVLPLAMKLVDYVFRPEQAACFIAHLSERQLSFALGKGLPSSFRPGQSFSFAQGRTGYVAGTRRAMDETDFQLATALVRRQLETTEIRGLRADVVAPVEDGDMLLAVLCIGGPTLRQNHAKRLLKMVADLTGVAMVYFNRLKATQEAASTDALTGILNKRAFQRRLGDEVHKAERLHVPLSLLILDIDHFKNYNDTNGHLEGDVVLKAIGQILQNSIREGDVASRYGGEEFVLLYPGANKSQALTLADNLRESIASYPFTHGAKQPGGRVTISGGVATFPDDARSSVELIRLADQALYEAKAAGRNRILVTPQAYLT